MQAPTIDPCTLIVNYVPTIVGNEELAAIFSPFGKITLARVIYDRASGEHRGFGFVRYATEGPALAAMQALNGLEIEKKRLKISYAHANAQDPQPTRVLTSGHYNSQPPTPPAPAPAPSPLLAAFPGYNYLAPQYAPAPGYQLVPMPGYALVPIAPPSAAALKPVPAPVPEKRDGDRSSSGSKDSTTTVPGKVKAQPAAPPVPSWMPW